MNTQEALEEILEAIQRLWRKKAYSFVVRELRGHEPEAAAFLSLRLSESLSQEESQLLQSMLLRACERGGGYEIDEAEADEDDEEL